MQQIRKIQPSFQSQKEQPPRSQSLTESTGSGLAIKQDQKGRDELSSLILVCFDALKSYGKEPEQVGNINALFQLVLSDYPIDKIREAFKAHIARSSEIPTPSDIVKLIKRNGKPPLDKSIYVALAQKKERTTFKECGGVYDCLTKEETEYMRDYEEEMMG